MRAPRSFSCLLLVACIPDPVSPVGVGSAGAYLSLQVAFVDGGDSIPGWVRRGVYVPPAVAPATGALVVWGSLSPGYLNDRLRTVSAPEVEVAGVRFAGATRQGIIEFGGSVTLPTNVRPNTILLPGVTGLAAPPRLVAPRIGHGPDAPTTTPTGLRTSLLVPDSTDAAGYTSHSWQGRVTQGTRTLEVTGTGLLGPRPTLPRWDGFTEPATIRLLQRSFATNPERAGIIQYSYYVSVTSSVRWTGIPVSPFVAALEPSLVP